MCLSGRKLETVINPGRSGSTLNRPCYFEAGIYTIVCYPSFPHKHKVSTLSNSLFNYSFFLGMSVICNWFVDLILLFSILFLDYPSTIN